MTEPHKRTRHPKYKTAYRVKNWAAYEKSLRDRGDITLWVSPEATCAWRAPMTGKRGAHIEIERVGRFQWKRTSGYYDQSRAENAFSRFKKTSGGRLRAKRDESQEREASLACQLLNQMLELGRPQSYPVS